MALIKCPECNGTVSSKASACPHCGWIVTNNLPVQPSPQDLLPNLRHDEPIKMHENESVPSLHNQTKQEAHEKNDNPDGTRATTVSDSKRGGLSQVLGVVVVFLVILGLNKVFPELKLLDSLPINKNFNRERTQKEQRDAETQALQDNFFKEQKLKTSWKWQIEFGTLNNNITVLNPSDSQLSNVELTITLLRDGKQRDFVLKADAIPPNGKCIWRNALSTFQLSLEDCHVGKCFALISANELPRSFPKSPEISK